MNSFTRVLQAIWGLYAWLCFVLACIFSLLVTIIVPGKQRRQKLVTLASRSIFVLAGIEVNMRGQENLPAGASVVVANHASYIDGVLLRAYLPWRFGFVIKGEMRNIPVVHFLLRRSGAKFVERNEAAGTSRDARSLVKAAKDGASLGFFPEGTFTAEPGVVRFRPGAFVAAIRGSVPVVPIAIHGTRTMLGAGRILPWRTPLTIDIQPPINPGDPEFASNRQLAEASRQRILAVLDEPDLVSR